MHAERCHRCGRLIRAHPNRWYRCETCILFTDFAEAILTTMADA